MEVQRILLVLTRFGIRVAGSALLGIGSIELILFPLVLSGTVGPQAVRDGALVGTILGPVAALVAGIVKLRPGAAACVVSILFAAVGAAGSSWVCHLSMNSLPFGVEREQILLKLRNFVLLDTIVGAALGALLGCGTALLNVWTRDRFSLPVSQAVRRRHTTSTPRFRL